MNQKQLWETLSNLAYPVAGLWTGEPVFMLMMLGLGIASAYYHAGGIRGNQASAAARRGANWDVGAIYAVLLFLIVAVWGLSPIIAIPVGVIPMAWWLRMKQLDVPMEHKIGGLMAVLIVFGVSSGIVLSTTSALAFFGLSSGVLLIALAIRKWVDHGLWHLVSAYGLALVWHAVSLSRLAG